MVRTKYPSRGRNSCQDKQKKIQLKGNNAGDSAGPSGLLRQGRLVGFVFEKFIETEELAAQGGAVGGPIVFTGGSGEGSADGGEFGIHVIQVVENKSFANHGEFRGTKFIFPVMANEDVLNDGPEAGWKALHAIHGLVDGVELHHDVAEELALRGVTDGALVAEFFELAHIVQQSSNEEEIDIEFRIVRGNLFREAAQADDMFEEATKIGMVHGFRGGRALEARDELRVAETGGSELP